MLCGGVQGGYMEELEREVWVEFAGGFDIAGEGGG